MAFAMNHKRVLAGVLAASTLLGLATSPVTFAAEMTSGSKPATSTDDLSTNTTVNPGASSTGELQNSSTTGTATVAVEGGDRTLDKVAQSFDFGSTTIAALLASDVTGTSGIPAGTFQVTDNSGNPSGWNLNASMTSFKTTGEKPVMLNGAGLSIKLGDDATDTPLTVSDNATSGTTGATIYTSKQRGAWDNKSVGTATLTLPKSDTVATGTYTANITYTLATVVAGK